MYKFICSSLILCICAVQMHAQSVYGFYLDTNASRPALVEIDLTNGNLSVLSVVDSVAIPTLFSSGFAIDNFNHRAIFFGYDSDNLYRLYSISLQDGHVISAPTLDDGGWGGLTFNPNDSVVYVMHGYYDENGTDLYSINAVNGDYTIIYHTDYIAANVSSAINTQEGKFITQASEYFTGTPDGKVYSINVDLENTSQSAVVECDYVSPEFILDIRYHPKKDRFYALKRDSDYTVDLVSFDPSSGQSDLIADLSGYNLANSGGGLLFDKGYYVFAGTYSGDIVQRIFSVDIETGEIVNEPALNMQVQVRTIGIDQSFVNGVSEKSDEVASFNVFPNPTSEWINFNMKAGTTYEVFDAFGQLILIGQEQGNGTVSLDVRGLDNGVYYIRMIGIGVSSFVVSK
ncbi:MAG: T9SS type A sorting domain-containing protein [Flavobacteriales bacterium]